jgi:hypothetical protein
LLFFIPSVAAPFAYPAATAADGNGNGSFELAHAVDAPEKLIVAADVAGMPMDPDDVVMRAPFVTKSSMVSRKLSSILPHAWVSTSSASHNIVDVYRS